MVNPLVANTDAVLHLEEFVRNQEYLFLALVSTTWKKMWGGGVPDAPALFWPT